MKNAAKGEVSAGKGYERLYRDRNSLTLRNNSTRVLQDSEIRPELRAAEDAAFAHERCCRERVVFQDRVHAVVWSETFLGNPPYSLRDNSLTALPACT